jgi:hypothetical protein
MITQASPHHAFQLALVENGVCLVAFTAACFWPTTGAKHFSRVERLFTSLATRPRLAVVITGLSVVLLRLAFLPIFPIPLPFNPDDFSFLLAADTFASGRVTNPTPVMWPHFESMHITMHPSYISMYFPAQGLLLAAGKVFLGHPWFGLLIVDGLMCAALCWMLQAWLPKTWAFAGAMIAVIRLGLFSYWINSYTGAGCVAALGGALVLGALPRITRGRLANGWWLAIGIAILILSRPYEGFLLCVPTAVVLGHWVLFGKNRPNPLALVRAAALPLLVVVAAGSWMAYYDSRSFGSPLTLPYTLQRTQYAVTPYYVWQSLRPEPAYRHAVMRDFYTRQEMKVFREVHSVSGFIPRTLGKVNGALQFYGGPALLIPLIMIGRTLRDRRIRFLVICMAVLCAGMVIEIYLVAHYLAVFTCAMYAIGLQAMRHLRVWKPGGRPVGLALVRTALTVCVLMVAIRLAAKPLGIVPAERPESEWMGLWYGPQNFGTDRANVQQQLEHLPGKHLVLVRYDMTTHWSVDEWIFNSPDIDNSKVIWAHEMDKASNDQLVQHYPDRQVWLAQPDVSTGILTRYPGFQHLGSSPELAVAEDAPVTK